MRRPPLSCCTARAIAVTATVHVSHSIAPICAAISPSTLHFAASRCMCTLRLISIECQLPRHLHCPWCNSNPHTVESQAVCATYVVVSSFVSHLGLLSPICPRRPPRAQQGGTSPPQACAEGE